MSTIVEEPWSPEPELREPAPRRLQPAEYPDLNVPDVKLYTAVGSVLLVVGALLIVLGIVGSGAGFAIGGALAGAAGAAALTLPPRKAARARARAERLVRDGQPIMARIVGATNSTGDSIYGRTVSYFVTLPGGEVARREVNADERALPKRIPGNVTALLDPADTNDVELYCALPVRAVVRAAPAPDPLAASDPGAPPGDGRMASADSVAQRTPQEQGQTQSQQNQSSSGYQGLPWE